MPSYFRRCWNAKHVPRSLRDSVLAGSVRRICIMPSTDEIALVCWDFCRVQVSAVELDAAEEIVDC